MASSFCASTAAIDFFKACIRPVARWGPGPGPRPAGVESVHRGAERAVVDGHRFTGGGAGGQPGHLLVPHQLNQLVDGHGRAPGSARAVTVERE